VTSILFLVHRVPYPPNRGDRIRSFHWLKALASRGDVDLAFLCDRPPSEAVLAPLRALCRRVAAVPLAGPVRWLRGAWSLARGRSATEGLFSSPQLRRALAAWIAETRYAAAVAYCSSMAQYLDLPGLDAAPAVVDLVDVDSQKWLEYAKDSWGVKRWLLGLEAGRLRRLESSLPARARAVTLVSQAEVDLFHGFCPAGNVHALSNGVDLDYFDPNHSTAGGRASAKTGSANRPLHDTVAIADSLHQTATMVHRTATVDRAAPSAAPETAISPAVLRSMAERAAVPTEHRGLPATLVFVGALDYRANIDGLQWFCQSVWPEVLRQRPGAALIIVGSNPGKAARRLGSLPGVRVCADVPDVRPYLAGATLVVAPLRVARGIQNKVLEAMAMAKPVIATPQALEGLATEPGRHACPASSPEEWVRAVVGLLGDPQARQRLADAGREHVVRHFRWDVRLAQFASLLPASPGPAQLQSPLS